MEKVESVCEENVFNGVYKTHAKALYNFMYYKCGDVSKAEDFVQESYIKLWNNCAKVVVEKAKSYLFTCANNLFLNHVAHQKIVLRHQKEGAKHHTNESPEFVLEEKEFMAKLQQTIAELPEDQRTIFLLNRIDKKKYREIAVIQDISMKTVEKKMSLALKYLEKNLDTIHKV